MLFTFLTIVTRWSRFTSNFYAMTGQNLTGEFMRRIYAASCDLFTLPAEADRILCQLVMFLTVFFLDVLDVQNEIQRLSRVFCYSSLVCLLNFWCQSRKSDFGWHRFCFSPCWMRKRIIKAQVILALLDSLQQLHLEIWLMSLFRLR